METICNARAWPHQCLKSCANAGNIVALRFGEKNVGMELLAQKFDKFQTSYNSPQQQATTFTRVFKRTQHVTHDNVVPVCAGLKKPPNVISAYYGLRFGSVELGAHHGL